MGPYLEIKFLADVINGGEVVMGSGGLLVQRDWMKGKWGAHTHTAPCAGWPRSDRKVGRSPGTDLPHAPAGERRSAVDTLTSDLEPSELGDSKGCFSHCVTQFRVVSNTLSAVSCRQALEREQLCGPARGCVSFVGVQPW